MSVLAIASTRSSRLAPWYWVKRMPPEKMPIDSPGKLISSRLPSVFTAQEVVAKVPSARCTSVAARRGPGVRLGSLGMTKGASQNETQACFSITACEVMSTPSPRSGERPAKSIRRWPVWTSNSGVRF